MWWNVNVCNQFSFSFYLLWFFGCIFGYSTSTWEQICLEIDYFLLKEKKKNQSQNDSLYISYEDFELKLDCCWPFLSTSTCFSLPIFPQNLMGYLSIFWENFQSVIILHFGASKQRSLRWVLDHLVYSLKLFERSSIQVHGVCLIIKNLVFGVCSFHGEDEHRILFLVFPDQSLLH